LYTIIKEHDYSVRLIIFLEVSVETGDLFTRGCTNTDIENVTNLWMKYFIEPKCLKLKISNTKNKQLF